MDQLLFKLGEWSVAVWPHWWWFHVERGEACTTWYIGPLVICRDKHA